MEVLRDVAVVPPEERTTAAAAGSHPTNNNSGQVPTSPIDSPCSPTSQYSTTTGTISDDNNSEITEAMPPGGKQRPNTPKREADFSALLNAGEKTELASLITKTTSHIEKQIIQVFDCTPIDESAARPARVSFWTGLPTRLRDLTISKPQPATPVPRRGNVRPTPTRKENMNPAQPTAASSSGPGTNEVADQSTNQGEMTTPAPRLQELKKEALVHFKKWQASVNKRVSDISVKKAADPQGGPNAASGSRRAYAPKPPSNRGGGRFSALNAPPRSLVPEHDFSLSKHYTPIPTSLSSLPVEKRTLLLHALLLLFLSLENYCAYTRTLLVHITASLHLPIRVLAEDEVRLAKSLAQVAKDIPTDEILRKKAEEGKSAKKWKAGLASMAGAAVVGVAGGLAAPLVAAGIGSVLGGIGLGGTAAAGLLGTVAESGLIVGALFGVYGARASGKAMEQYTKDVEDFAFIPLRGSIGEDCEIGKVEPDVRRLRVVIGVSGWLENQPDVISPWKVLGQQSEVYSLRWEADSLFKMETALETVLRSTSWSMARKEIISRTKAAQAVQQQPESQPEPEPGPEPESQEANHQSPVLACLQRAVWPLGLLRISKIIDNPWTVGMVRADKAGYVLADLIMNKAHGERGVTLMGFSLGARVIYSCLMALAEKRTFGLVENVVLMGAPAPSSPLIWATMRSVVSGRLVNVYSENDCILGFLYRMSSFHYGVAGLERIKEVDGVENVDVSAKVSGHLRYRHLVGSILEHIGWEDVDSDEVTAEEDLIAEMEAANRERERQREALERGETDSKTDEKTKKNEKEQEAIRTRARKKKGKR